MQVDRFTNTAPFSSVLTRDSPEPAIFENPSVVLVVGFH